MKTAQFYNAISRFYPIINLFLKSYKKRLIQEVNNFPTASILEIGIGQSNYLKDYKSQNITAIDFSYKMLRTAEKVNPKNINFIEMDATNLNFDNEKFDLVVCAHVLSTSIKTDELLKESYRVLKTNGSLIILNHISPNNFTKYFYKAFNPVARLLCFNSYFNLEKYSVIKKLSLQKQITFGVNKNYQLLTYQKIEK